MAIRPVVSIIASIVLAGGASVARAGEVRLAAGPPFRSAMALIIPAFEKASGHKVTLDVVNGGPWLEQGDKAKPFDITIQTPGDFELLSKAGKLPAGASSAFVTSRVALAVRAGATKPDISSVEAVKQALLAAKSVGYSRGASGIAFMASAQSIGLADAVKAKGQVVAGPVGAAVAKGDVELGAQQFGEFLPIKGIEIVGLLPVEISPAIRYRIAVVGKPADPVATKALVDYLASDASMSVLKSAGYPAGG